MPAEAATPNSRRVLLIVAAVSLGPLAAAFLLYYGGNSTWRPAGRTNHGDLIEPPRPFPSMVLLSADDQQLDAQFLHGKWSLVYVGEGSCDTRCRTALTLMRQTRLALNKDAQRVQRVFFITGHCCDQDYLREHPGLITARLEEAPERKLLALFPGTSAAPASSAGRIYIIDPLGNMMMSYESGAPPEGLLADLKKLLKLSHIG